MDLLIIFKHNPYGRRVIHGVANYGYHKNNTGTIDGLWYTYANNDSFIPYDSVLYFGPVESCWED